MLKAVCFAKLGEVFKASQFLAKRTQSDFGSTMSGDYLHLYCSALIAKRSDNFPLAVEYFEQAYKKIDSEIEVDAYLLPINDLEFSEYLIKSGDPDRAEQVLKRIERVIKQDVMPITYSWLQELRSNHCPPSTVELVKYHFDTQYLIKVAEQRIELDATHHRLRKINLINTLQLLADKVEDSQKLLEDGQQLISSNFTIEFGSIYLFKNKKWLLQSYFEKTKSSLDVRQISSDFLDELCAQDKPKIHLKTVLPFTDGTELFSSSLLNIPLKNGDMVIGCLLVATVSEQVLIHHQDIDVLSLIAIQLGNLNDRLEREKVLRLLSTTDPLTGLLNRQALEAKLEDQVSHCPINTFNECNFCLMFIDLDNFKFFNDTFGHEVGDALLQHFSGFLLNLLRKTDFVSRYGGDEFVVVLPNISLNLAKNLADRIILTLHQQHSFKAQIEPMISGAFVIPPEKEIACSIGVTEYNESNGDGMDHVRLADQALYQAKKLGKSRAITI